MLEQLLHDFLPWCAARKITWHQNVRLVQTSGEGGGVEASGAMQFGDIVISVPRASALGAGSSKVVASIAPKYHLAFAACQARANSNEYADWVALWPSGTEGTWSLAKEERDMLAWCDELTRLEADENEALAHVQAEVTSPSVTDASQANELPAESDFRWGLGIVSSRAADVVINGEARPTLLPLIDMMNHRVDPNLTLAFEPGSDCIVARVTAPAGIAAGEELSIRYGKKDNAQLLHGYGFAMRPNPYDALLLSVPVGEDANDPLAVQRIAMLPRGIVDTGGGGDAQGPLASGRLTWQRMPEGQASPSPMLTDELRALLLIASATSIEQMFAAMTTAAGMGQGDEEEADVAPLGAAGGFDPSSLPAEAWRLLTTCCAAALEALPPPRSTPQGADGTILTAAATALEARRDLLVAALAAATEAVADPDSGFVA